MGCIGEIVYYQRAVRFDAVCCHMRNFDEPMIIKEDFVAWSRMGTSSPAGKNVLYVGLRRRTKQGTFLEVGDRGKRITRVAPHDAVLKVRFPKIGTIALAIDDIKMVPLGADEEDIYYRR